MDIELSLRQLLVLENPGSRFTDGVMARVGDAPAKLPSEGVVRLSDARLRKRSRGILLGTLVAMGVAASMLSLMPRGQVDAPMVHETLAAPAGVSSPSEEIRQAQIQPGSKAPGDLQPRQCFDQDVLRALLLRSPLQTFHVLDTAPPELADFKAPRQLTRLGVTEQGIGSSSSTVITTSVVFRAGLALDAARAAAVSALTTVGWKLQAADSFGPANVFTGMNSRTGDIFCRAGKPVNVTANSLDGMSYVVLSVTRGSPGEGLHPFNACDQPMEPRVHATPELDKYLPQFQLPRDPGNGQPVSTQGSGARGGPNPMMNVSFTLRGTAGDVANHFAKQLVEQGWDVDATWNGAVTAGSTWSRMGDAGSVLHATLTVSAFEQGRFTAVFQVTTTK